jgi:hypothetical protein
LKALNHMRVATIWQLRTLCSPETRSAPRRDKMPLWNIETLHLHQSFIAEYLWIAHLCLST